MYMYIIYIWLQYMILYTLCLCVSLCVSMCLCVSLCVSLCLSVCGVAGEGLGRPGTSLKWKSVSQVFVGTFVWGGWVSKGQGVGRLGAIYLNLPQVTLGREFLNMRSGPCHLDIRTELVFHTTSEPAGSGPATTYLNVVTVCMSGDSRKNNDNDENRQDW